jgi:hypothetical protein
MSIILVKGSSAFQLTNTLSTLPIHNKAIYYDYDRALAHPPKKTERNSVTTGGIFNINNFVPIVFYFLYKNNKLYYGVLVIRDDNGAVTNHHRINKLLEQVRELWAIY